MLYAAIIAIAVIQIIQSINMKTVVRRIMYLEKEHLHLAEETGKAVKRTQKSTDKVIQSGERVIASPDEMTEAFRDLVQEVSNGEQQSDSTVEEDAVSPQPASI